MFIGALGSLFTWLDTVTGTTAFSTLYSVLMTFLLPLFTLYLYNIYQDLKSTRPEEKVVSAVTNTKIWMAIIGVWGILALIVTFALLIALVVKAL